MITDAPLETAVVATPSTALRNNVVGFPLAAGREGGAAELDG